MKNKQLPEDGFNDSQIESILAQVYFFSPRIAQTKASQNSLQTLIPTISSVKVVLESVREGFIRTWYYVVISIYLMELVSQKP